MDRFAATNRGVVPSPLASPTAASTRRFPHLLDIVGHHAEEVLDLVGPKRTEWSWELVERHDPPPFGCRHQRMRPTSCTGMEVYAVRQQSAVVPNAERSVENRKVTDSSDSSP